MFCNKCGDPVEANERFCNKCGNPITYNQNTTPVVVNTVPKSSNSNKKMIAIGAGIGSVISVVLIIILSLVSKFNKMYYFDTKSKDNDSDVVQSTKSSSNSSYTTSIIYDNKYTGVKIEKDKDAYDLIVEDSVKQKKKCPKEIKSVEDEIIKNYGITAVNLCEMDPAFAKEIGNVFKKIYDEYPGARGYITNLTLVNAPMSENYIAAFMPMFVFAFDKGMDYPWVIKTQMLLNTSYFLNTERLDASVKDGSNSGHFPKNATIYSPVAHEMGHYLSFLAMMKHYQSQSILIIDTDDSLVYNSLHRDFADGEYSLTMINEAFANYKKDTNTTMSLDEWRGTISQYALAKDNNGNYIYDETIAESFHDVYLNGDKAADASKYVVAVLKSKLES